MYHKFLKFSTKLKTLHFLYIKICSKIIRGSVKVHKNKEIPIRIRLGYDCLVNSLLRIPVEQSRIHRDATGDRWIPLTKGRYG